MPLDAAELGAILAASPDAVLVVEPHGGIDFASDRAHTMFGYSPAELTSQTVDRLVPLRHRRAFAKGRARCFAGQSAMRGDLRLAGLRRDGSEFAAYVAVRLFGSGAALRAICNIRENARTATERDLRRALLALQTQADSARRDAERSQEHLRLFVRHAPSAVAMLDRGFRYLLVSERWLQDYGLGERNIIGLSHYAVFPEIPEAWKEAHRRCLAGAPQKCAEDSFLRPDGKVEWLRWELLPWRDAEGAIGGIIILTEVITDRKRAELALIHARDELEARVESRTRQLQLAKAEAERANRSKSRFVAVTGHDLRQPLQAAVTYLAVLRRRLTDPALRAICDLARAPLEAMAEILKVMLDAARLEDGAIQPSIAEFSLMEMLRPLLASSRAQAEQKGLALTVEAQDCVIRTDPAFLGQILGNLLSNAIRFTETGSVTLRVERSAEMARISVSDTGIGIPADALDAIFEAYVQLGNPARQRGLGLGVGLFVVKYLASLLNLQLDVRSTLGTGSTFEISVPVGASQERHKGRARPRPGAPAEAVPNPVVLLVEDDPAVRDSALMLLNVSGFEAIGAQDGAAALALLARGLEPHVVVSDLRLPGMDGEEVIRQVRGSLGRDIPAILTTGDTGVSAASFANLPNCLFMHKPVDGEALVQAILRLAGWPA